MSDFLEAWCHISSVESEAHCSRSPGSLIRALSLVLDWQEAMEGDKQPEVHRKRGRPPLPKPCGTCGGCASGADCIDHDYLTKKAELDARKAARGESVGSRPPVV